MPDFKALAADCLSIRNEIVDIIHGAQSGHTGGSLSCVEILWTLYNQYLNVRPEEPDWPDRDRFVLSKGHAAPALYVVLGRLGFVDRSKLPDLRKAGSIFQGHPDMRKVPGVEISAGSLGMGISVGVGMALAARLSKKDYRVFVLVGDGELQEGQNWEAMQAANKYQLKNLVVIVDNNGVQLDGPTERVMPMGDLVAKLAAFGFETRACDGHDCRTIHDAVGWSIDNATGPRAIVANTVKGKGVSFMEGESAWHGKPISEDDYRIAKKDLATAAT